MQPLKHNVAIVIPTIRDVVKTLDAWGNQFNDCMVYIIEDHNKIELPTADLLAVSKKYNYRSIKHYSHAEIKYDLGDSAWIIPHKNASVRSYGYYKAWQDDAEYIITIDDDCYPDPQYDYNNNDIRLLVDLHIRNLQTQTNTDWMSSVSNGMRTRGLPYDLRKSKVMVSHGLWKNVPDLDGISQVVNGATPKIVQANSIVVPKGYYYPMCGMNLAFHSDATPLMYFLLQGADYMFDRFDDIWAGIFSKKIMDMFDWSVVSGPPFVWHSRASDAWTNMLKEHTGLQVNEHLYTMIQDVQLAGDTPHEAYSALAAKMLVIGEQMGDKLSNTTLKTNEVQAYFNTLGDAMQIWAQLFDTTD